jgi:hypothetical protein
MQSDHHGYAGIAQVQRMRVTLASVADDRHRLALQQGEISVIFVETLGH